MTYSWNVAHRDRKREYDRGYRLNRWRESRRKIFARDHFTCVYCKATLPEKLLTIDHKEPLLQGRVRSSDGLDDPSAVVTACFLCNRKKSTKSYTWFMALMQPDRLPDWVTDDFAEEPQP